MSSLLALTLHESLHDFLDVSVGQGARLSYVEQVVFLCEVPDLLISHAPKRFVLSHKVVFVR